LAYAIIEAKKSYDTPSESWRASEVSVTAQSKSKGLRISGTDSVILSLEAKCLKIWGTTSANHRV
jgi:hypothetical protein